MTDLIETANPTPDEISRVAARCAVIPFLVDRLYRALPVVFLHLNRQELERLVSSRQPSLRDRAEAGSVTREPGSASRAGSRADTESPAYLVAQALAGLIGHVFFSSVREDSIEVGRLPRLLESAGIRVWRDTADLWPGKDWRVKIRQAITDNALVFVACFPAIVSPGREVLESVGAVHLPIFNTPTSAPTG